MNSESLSSIFDKYKSDKGTFGDGHGYADAYETLVPRTSKKILEIGIGTHLNFNGSCGSILGWLEWISGDVVGFDINDPTVEISSDRFTFVKGDQGVPSDLSRLADIVGSESCEAIIDDGSHIPSHQFLTMEMLWPCVAPGGVYVIEDTHLRYGDGPCPSDVLASDPRLESRIGRYGNAMVFRKKT